MYVIVKNGQSNLSFTPHITGSKPPTSGNKVKPIRLSVESIASKCPIGSRAFRAHPCGTTNPWGINKIPKD